MKTTPDPKSLSTFVDPRTRDYILAVFENYAKQSDARMRLIEDRIATINGPQDKAIAELRADMNAIKQSEPQTKNELVYQLRQLQEKEKFDG